MKRCAASLVAVVCLMIMLLGAGLASAQTPAEILIDHTPPAIVLPGLQINLTAVLTNATAASVSWNNGSMSNDSWVPMSNTSVAQGAGWVYAAWLPAQADGVQVSYTINASSAETTLKESYFLVVASPSLSGLTAADQYSWMLTMAASLSMAISTMAVLYWYASRRLRRNG